MLQAIILTAVLSAEPTAADQKCIDKAWDKVTAWRDAQAAAAEQKIIAMQDNAEQAANGEIDETLTVPFVKRGKKYVFHSVSYKANYAKKLSDDAKNEAANLAHKPAYPELNMLALKRGAVGRVSSGGGEGEPYHGGTIGRPQIGPKGHAFVLMRVTLPGNTFKQIAFAVAGMDPADANARTALTTKGYVVAGTIKHNGATIPRLLPLEP